MLTIESGTDSVTAHPFAHNCGPTGRVGISSIHTPRGDCALLNLADAFPWQRRPGFGVPCTMTTGTVMTLTRKAQGPIHQPAIGTGY